MFFKKQAPRQPADRYQVDTHALDTSFKLLQSTTAEVSHAATKAAKSLQARLDDTVHRFYNTIDNLDDLILIKDGQGCWQTLNRYGQQLFGMLHGEYVGKTSAELAEQFPQLRVTLDYCMATDSLTWEARKPLRSQKVVPVGLEQRYLDVIKTPVFGSAGERKELIVVGRDVTDLWEKNKRNKACFTALNSASDAIVIIDDRARIFFCNDRFIDMFNLVDYHFVTGKKLIEIFPDIPNYDSMWDHVQQNKTWSKYCPTTKSDLMIIPVMNSAPNPIYYICTFKMQHE